MKSIEEQIWDFAAAHPDKTAVKSRTAQATYGELCHRIMAAANLYRGTLGMTPGETVVVASDGDIEFLCAYFGAHMAGLRAAPLDSHTSRDRLGQIAAAARNINRFVGTAQDDVELLALPLGHSFGLGRVRCCLSAGATLVLHGGIANAGRLFKAMETAGATGFAMVPAGWRYLRRMSGLRLGDFAHRLRYVEMGSATLSVAEKRELADLLPATRLCMHYGLTEASRSAFWEFHTDAAHLDSVGRPTPGVTIAILSDDGHTLPPGEEGEICVGGDHTARHYLSDDESGDASAGGLFRTGDLGRVDGEGYLHLTGRKKEQINVGGKKVSPDEVEEALMQIDGVADCACVGAADPAGVLGEVVKACVVRKDGSCVSPKEVREAMSGKMEAWKLPVVIEFVEMIPTTENGKKQRNKLA